jgi:hypothetical protein
MSTVDRDFMTENADRLQVAWAGAAHALGLHG